MRKRNGPTPWHEKHDPMDRARRIDLQRRARIQRTGKAIGGPRDGVLLTASLAWNGVIQGHLEHNYKWDNGRDAWVWVTSPAPRLLNGRPPKQRNGE